MLKIRTQNWEMAINVYVNALFLAPVSLKKYNLKETDFDIKLKFCYQV